MTDLITIQTIQGEEDRKFLFEQYKVVTESLNKINEIRETANNFWTGLNGALISAVAYVKQMEDVGENPKQFFLWTIITVGFCMSMTWLSYLLTIKKSVDIRNNMLLEFEKYFPAKPFTIAIDKMGRKEGKGSLSFKEMRAPILFIAGYIFFAFTLLFYPRLLMFN